MTRLRILLFALLAALIALPAAAWAQDGKSDFPKLSGRVVDQANLIPADREAALTARLEGIERETGRQLVVATVPSLRGMEIDQYGPLLARNWGIGQADKDDGVLLLVAPNERRVRIDTGYGAGAFLTDLVAGRIVREQITPRFKAGDYPGGIEAGVEGVAGWLKLPAAEAERRSAEIGAGEAGRRSKQSQGGNFGALAFWGMIVMFVLLSFGRGLGGRRYRGGGRGRSGFNSGDAAVLLWGLSALSRGNGGGSGGSWGGSGGFGGGGGGFGGFSGGGGGFGGGGASGSW